MPKKDCLDLQELIPNGLLLETDQPYIFRWSQNMRLSQAGSQSPPEGARELVLRNKCVEKCRKILLALFDNF